MVVGLALLGFSAPADARPQIYCKYIHTIEELPRPSFMCTRFEPSEDQLASLHKAISKTLKLYPKFARAHDFSMRSPKPLAIMVVSYKEMNDPDLFGKEICRRKAIARYFPDAEMIYVLPTAIDDTVSDVPHELTHWLNKQAGMGWNEELDEALAQAFEQYYISH